jgi:periplasmic protein TonB
MKLNAYISIMMFFYFLSTSIAMAQVTDTLINETKTDTIASADKLKNTSILTIAEQMPTYPGGEDAMYEFLGSKIMYPKYAKENNITGTLIITFVVESDGSITDVRALKDIGGGCGEEAIRVVKSMPKWTPGKQNGELVRVQYNLPIRFTLEKGGWGCFGLF